MFIIDMHLDLSMNAMEWNRDLTRPVHEIREREKDLTDKPDRGKGTVSLPALQHRPVEVDVPLHRRARQRPSASTNLNW